MRIIFLFWVVLITSGVFGIVALISKPFGRAPEQSAPTESVALPEQLVQVPPRLSPRDARSSQSESRLGRSTGEPTIDTNLGRSDLATRSISHRKAEFFDLAMRDDSDSLNTLLAATQDSSREIRKAALEAVIQFDDRSAIPHLQELANRTDDPEEKNEILAAINYIKLPSLSEYLAERRDYRAALGITEKRRSVLRP